MLSYQHVLCLVGLSDHCEVTAERACALRDLNKSKLSLLYFSDQFPLSAYAMGTIEVCSKPDTDAKKHLASLAGRLNVPIEQVFMEHLPVKEVLSGMINDQGVDLIVVGHKVSHGFLTNWLESPGEEVIHSASCDVWLVS